MHVSAVTTVLLKTITRNFERESVGNGSKEMSEIKHTILWESQIVFCVKSKCKHRGSCSYSTFMNTENSHALKSMVNTGFTYCS